MFTGRIIVFYQNIYIEKELIKMVETIENYYENTNEKYDSNKIEKLLKENKKLTMKLIIISEDYFQIRGFSKGRSMSYNSIDKKLYNEGLRLER